MLSAERVLIDIQRLSVKQATSLTNISSDIVDRFVNVFQSELSPGLATGLSEGMASKLQDEFRPTMQRMNDTLSELRGALERIESQKQESVRGEIRTLLSSLESSMTSALGRWEPNFIKRWPGQLGTNSAPYKGRSKGRPTCSAK